MVQECVEKIEILPYNAPISAKERLLQAQTEQDTTSKDLTELLEANKDLSEQFKGQEETLAQYENANRELKDRLLESQSAEIRVLNEVTSRLSIAEGHHTEDTELILSQERLIRQYEDRIRLLEQGREREAGQVEDNIRRLNEAAARMTAVNDRVNRDFLQRQRLATEHHMAMTVSNGLVNMNHSASVAMQNMATMSAASMANMGNW